MSNESFPRPGSIVLGVDDEALNLKLLSATVAGMGYSFLGARSGEECLEILKKAAPRAILLDVMMPGTDGFEVCKHIRNEFPLLQCRIIFQTALNSKDDILKAMAATGDDYIVKPIQPKMLRKRLLHWIAK
jgi:CheY-like chemotaxis protein